MNIDNEIIDCLPVHGATYDSADYEKDDRNLWVYDMNIDTRMIDCLPVHGATYDRRITRKMTVTFGT